MKTTTLTKKIAVLALFTALGLITFMIENAFPPLILPGAKMGLANIFSFAALIMYSPIEAFIVVFARTVLGAVFAGNFSTVIYSFAGGVLSMTVSSVLIYAVHPKISVMAVSVIAAVCHNIAQNIVFALISQTKYMLTTYMPATMLLGVLSGAIVGATILLIFKKVPISVFERFLYKKQTH